MTALDQRQREREKSKRGRRVYENRVSMDISSTQLSRLEGSLSNRLFTRVASKEPGLGWKRSYS